MVKIQFIANKRHVKQPWGADFFLDAAQKYSKHEVVGKYGYDSSDECDIVHYHNLSATALGKDKGKHKLLDSTLRALEGSPKVIGGVRGWQGYRKGLDFFKSFDAIHVGSIALKHAIDWETGKVVHINYPGVDLDLFKPTNVAPPFTVVWVGDKGKPVKNYYIINQLNIFERIIASKDKYVAHDQMGEFYNRGSVLLNLSSSEGFCRPIIEAMACGLPVISTDTGIASEVLEEEWIIGDVRTRQGYLDLISKIKYLEKYPKIGYKVGARNRIVVGSFSWQKRIEILDKIWEKVVND